MSTVLVPLGKKKLAHATIDVHHLPLVSKYTWSLHQVKCQNVIKLYARTWNCGKPIYMHRLIMGLPAFKIVDHKNGDGLINTDANLRIGDYSSNNHNSNRSSHRGYYRVGWKWRACVKEGKSRHLGMFPTRAAAKQAYDQAVNDITNRKVQDESLQTKV